MQNNASSPSAAVTEKAQVTIAVPRSGRTLDNFLYRLKALNAIDADLVERMIGVSHRTKAESTLDYSRACAFLNEIHSAGLPYFGIFIDRKRSNRPYRIGFLAIDIEIAGVRVRLEGDEPHNSSSLIRLEEIDLTVTGLDELLTVSQSLLNEPTKVTKWGMYNYKLPHWAKMRIAGSAMLTRHNAFLQREILDIVGFFLIRKPGKVPSAPGAAAAQAVQNPWHRLAMLSNTKSRVFVKGRYADVVSGAYALNVVPVEDVEDAVVDSAVGDVGLEIVQSGGTIVRKGLEVHGAPLFLSESVYVVNYARYQESQALRDVLQALNPVGYFQEERLQHIALWYHTLTSALGDAWIGRPSLQELLATPDDVFHGLRPYRLGTRYWAPDDTHKKEEAVRAVWEAISRANALYGEVK